MQGLSHAFTDEQLNYIRHLFDDDLTDKEILERYQLRFGVLNIRNPVYVMNIRLNEGKFF